MDLLYFQLSWFATLREPVFIQCAVLWAISDYSVRSLHLPQSRAAVTNLPGHTSSGAAAQAAHTPHGVLSLDARRVERRRQHRVHKAA